MDNLYDKEKVSVRKEEILDFLNDLDEFPNTKNFMTFLGNSDITVLAVHELLTEGNLYRDIENDLWMIPINLNSNDH